MKREENFIPILPWLPNNLGKNVNTLENNAFELGEDILQVSLPKTQGH